MNIKALRGIVARVVLYGGAGLLAPLDGLLRGVRLLPRLVEDEVPSGLGLVCRCCGESGPVSRAVLRTLCDDLEEVGPRRHRGGVWSGIWLRLSKAALFLLDRVKWSPESQDLARVLARWEPDLASPAMSPHRAHRLLRHFETDWGRNPFPGERSRRRLRQRFGRWRIR